MRILVAVEAVDFRSGIDGLARICKQQLQADPFSGAVYVFRNRRSTSIKALVYDGQGFGVCQKPSVAAVWRSRCAPLAGVSMFARLRACFTTDETPSPEAKGRRGAMLRINT